MVLWSLVALALLSSAPVWAGGGKQGQALGAAPAVPVTIPAGQSVSQNTDITAAVLVDFTTMDPQDTSDTLSGGIQRLMMDGLFGFDNDMKVINLLAESYTANENATEFTFVLKRGSPLPTAPLGRGRLHRQYQEMGRQVPAAQADLPACGRNRYLGENRQLHGKDKADRALRRPHSHAGPPGLRHYEPQADCRRG